METDLLERYIAEIGKHLPGKDREDIQQEIRSTLEDMLEDRKAKSGGEADEQMVVDLLKEFGKPEDVAASYLPERHLVGPSLYPLFALIVKIVLPVLAAVLLITMSFAIFTAQMSPLSRLMNAGKMLLELMQILLTTFGSITLTFAILEWVFSTRKEKTGKAAELDLKVKEESAWDPRSLPERRELEKFSIPGLMVEIALTLLAVVVLNLFPGIIGVYNQVDGEWTKFPLLAQAFFSYLPYLNALWGLQIVVNFILLQRGRWEPLTRWLHIAMTGLGIALAFFMLTGPDLIVPVGQSLATAAGLDLEEVHLLDWLPSLMVRVALLIAMVLSGIDFIRAFVREVSGKAQR